ncbi:DUF748 domain-containing protein [Desulfoferrobacter suflitae]|uniref:DUF748 domain-containing protein n=1 Tax=Desulfoferrobacter suflitae TaxID=2865782 RepID=UPI002164DC48|nr:DUF748 domain-containing protein [Desulfoferrobacter suflitae]MCK8601700.1 DUF748 domain-containing protein [Desulfoferrobacter suflitae]
MKIRFPKRLGQLNRLQQLGLALLLLLLLYSGTGFLVLPAIIKALLVKNVSEQTGRQVAIEKLYLNPFALTVQIDGFDIKDKESSRQTFASFQKLYINLDISSLFQRALIIEQIALEEPYVRVVRIDQERFNFTDLLPDKGAAAEQDAQDASRPVRFSIGHIELIDGRIEIVDGLHNRTHSVDDLDVSVPLIDNTGNQEGARIEPSLTAKVNHSPVTISGYVELFTHPPKGTANLSIQDVDSTYYAAYLPQELNLQLASGKLNLQAKVDFARSEAGRALLKLSGNAVLSDLKLLSLQDDQLFAGDGIEIDVDDYDLFAGRLQISRVHVQSPELNISRAKSGKINLAALYVPDEKDSAAEAGATRDNGFMFTMDELAVSDGTITFVDSAVPGSFATTVSAIDLTMKHFTNVPKSRVDVHLSAKTEAGESIKVQGGMSLDPLVANGTVEFSKISLAKYFPYYGNRIPFDLGGGGLNFSADCHYAEGGHGPWIKLNTIHSSLNSVKLHTKEGEEFVNIGSMTLEGGEFDLTGKRLNLHQISSSNGTLKLTRYADGTLSLQKLLPALDSQMEPSPGAKTQQSGKPWHISLKGADFNDYSLHATDLGTPRPVTVTVDKLKLNLADFSTIAGHESTIGLAFLINNSGKLSAAGKIRLDPFYADLDLTVEDVEITPFERYYRDFVRVYITGGRLSAAGRTIIDLARPNEARTSYSGDISVTDFSSLPGREDKEIVSWKTFALEGVDAGNAPLHLNIEKVDLVELTSYVRIKSDGTINFRQVLKEKEDMPLSAGGKRQSESAKGSVVSPPAESFAQTGGKATRAANRPAGATKGPMPISVKQIALKDCIIDFTDDLIQPNFHASFYQATGTVTGLSSQKGTSADVHIKAKLEEYAPAEISGRINPLAEELFMDMQLAGSNLDLTLANPYSRKFIGYPIEKGKLNFKFFYQIDSSKLNAYHHLKFEKLQLGDKIADTGASDLPLKFALSVLQNRDGDMVLDIPVSGEIDNPKFDFTQIIKGAVSNVFKKVITAPFALLGSIFGAAKGEDLSYVTFDPGSDEITTQAAKKLEIVAKALDQRPKLQLDVSGYIDKQKDTAALKEQKQKAQAEPPPADDAGGNRQMFRSISRPPQGETEVAGSSQTAGSTNTPHHPKDQPRQKLALAFVQVGPEELRALARKRAASVVDFLATSGKVDPRRIFVVSPKSLEPQEKSIKTASCATLSVK